MKKILLSFSFVLLLLSLQAQSPEGINYQAIARTTGGDVIANQLVSFRISILEGSTSGTSVYSETHSLSTNAFGLANLVIGSGIIESGVFADIDWGTNSHFVKIELDETGGTTYSLVGTSQLMSVPYALHAKTADRLKGCGLQIGDNYAGGIIFYLDASGCHGLVAAPTDQGMAQWYNGTFTDTYAYGNGVSLGDGNTSSIVRLQGGGSYAAKICYDLNLAGFYDWYLPSKYELNLMYQSIGQGASGANFNIGGFSNFNYWSSTEYDSFSAWAQRFDNGGQFGFNKGNSSSVRAVRAF